MRFLTGCNTRVKSLLFFRQYECGVGRMQDGLQKICDMLVPLQSLGLFWWGHVKISLQPCVGSTALDGNCLLRDSESLVRNSAVYGTVNPTVSVAQLLPINS